MVKKQHQPLSRSETLKRKKNPGRLKTEKKSEFINSEIMGLFACFGGQKAPVETIEVANEKHVAGK